MIGFRINLPDRELYNAKKKIYILVKSEKAMLLHQRPQLSVNNTIHVDKKGMRKHPRSGNRQWRYQWTKKKETCFCNAGLR